MPLTKPKLLQRKWSGEDLEEKDVNNLVKDSWEEEEKVAVEGDKEETEVHVYDSWEEIPEDSWAVPGAYCFSLM